MNDLSLKQFALAACAALVLSCATSRMPEAAGTNTNWLTSCENDSDCGDALSCHCGLCTKPCDDADACDGLGEGALCAPIDDSTCSQGDSYCVAAGDGGAAGTGSGGTSGGDGDGDAEVAGSGGEGGTSARDGDAGDDFALFRVGAGVITPQVYKSCDSSEDCMIVGTSCDGCCMQTAIVRSLESTFNEQLELACADYAGGECSCQESELVPRCIERSCVTIPNPSLDCYSPTQNTNDVYATDRVGCECQIKEQSVCVGSAALVCMEHEGALRWQSVEDGPCEPREDICPLPAQRDNVTTCLDEYSTCYELDNGKFCGERCYELLYGECTPETCPDYEAIPDNMPCGDFGIGVWEGECGDGDHIYRVTQGGFFAQTDYYYVKDGRLVARDESGDSPFACNMTSNTLVRGDLDVVHTCNVVVDDTTKKCVD